MNITAADLYRSILFRAADIYEVDYEDVERDIGQQFDPLVRFLAGATASELERVYQHIYDTESRLQKRLAKVLLPEYFHLPQPAHALATARPSSEALTIDETLELVRSAEENQEAVHFSPVFRHQILPASIALVATETKILDPKARPNLRRGRIREKEEARRIIIGIEASEPLLHWEGASLYFDLRGRGKDESERAQFFSALPNSHCRFGGFSLTVRNGLPPQELLLEDYLNGNERLHRTVRARYQRHFLTFGPREIP
ncbi:MAG: type VI secretion system baseplate subunit TssF, partial [Bacteroidota bacterium]